MTMGGTSPSCPNWCPGHATTWDAGSSAMTKTCRRVVLVEIATERAEIELERFAELVDGQLTVHPPTVRVMTDEAFSLEFAGHLGDTVARVVEIGQHAAAA